MIDYDYQSEKKNFETASTSSSEAETENFYQVKIILWKNNFKIHLY